MINIWRLKMIEEHFTELKRDVDDLIWHYSPKNLTLEDAEALASSIISAIVEGKRPVIYAVG
jgi:hypothetical protein